VVGLFFLWGEAEVGLEAPAEVHDAVLPEELGALLVGVVGWMDGLDRRGRSVSAVPLPSSEQQGIVVVYVACCDFP
jgi:hypothetical protein